ncbi:DNA alkylation repair protein [Streptomyces sp. GESEQ-35]|uniref:DNA alkylation repair protein n=1 Tax=Streptomyces sp. GESEQ-35 TaxID=2812657 RepID=UPI001B32E9ED|nr:DNA alkylation repair protein [Streptomyces sp. GESEQ-35]
MPFADDLINRVTAQVLVRAIRQVRPGSPLSALRRASTGLDGLGLRARADLLRDALLDDLPGDYVSFADAVRQAARDSQVPFDGWLIWPVTSAVAVKATQEDTPGTFEDALALLAELTGRLTSEFALRTLLNHDLDQALKVIASWTCSDDVDVRRLASEGTRPYLPWAVRVPAILNMPESTLPLLNALYRDDSEYVRRSVANHLNDLSRHAPDLVVETATAWLARPDDHTPRLVRHGLRGLVKQAHPGALALLGFTPASVELTGPTIADPAVAIGGTLTFTATIRNTDSAPVRLAIDYVIHHLAADGTMRPKVFKLTTRTVEPGQELRLRREHSFRPVTTRRYYPGGHAMELQVNGVRSPQASFELLPASQTR